MHAEYVSFPILLILMKYFKNIEFKWHCEYMYIVNFRMIWVWIHGYIYEVEISSDSFDLWENISERQNDILIDHTLYTIAG